MSTDPATKYDVAFPLSKSAQYVANDSVNFILSLEGKKLVPGSISICGNVKLGIDVSTPSAVTALAIGEEVVMDPEAGFHSMFRDIVTEFRQIGVTETFTYYPRYVKMKTQCTKDRNSLGTETYNCIEGKCPSGRVSRGLSYGLNDSNAASAKYATIPFVVKPDIAANKTNVPIPGDQVGTVRLQCRLAPNNEVVYGSDVTSLSGYVITDLHLRYEYYMDDGSRPPMRMEVYNVSRQVIETNEANLSTFVPGLADAVHISFNTVADESSGATGINKNYLRCKPIPGVPLDSDDHSVSQTYGAERVTYAINDTDTALVGFTMESREELLWNYLRSFNNEPRSYGATLRRTESSDADGYGIGINFGTLLDFTQQKFACEIDSQISEPTSAYLYFRGIVSV